MGKLVDGTWHDVWYETAKNDGHFKRKDSSFRHWVTKDGSAGPSGAQGLRRSQGVTICMCHTLARGRIER